MSETSQRRAVKKYRERLAEKGMARFEVLGLDEDRKLIRALAKRLAEGGPEAEKLRAIVGKEVRGGSPQKGGILRALRRSPMVGADLDLTREIARDRKVDL